MRVSRSEGATVIQIRAPGLLRSRAAWVLLPFSLSFGALGLALPVYFFVSLWLQGRLLQDLASGLCLCVSCSVFAFIGWLLFSALRQAAWCDVTVRLRPGLVDASDSLRGVYPTMTRDRFLGTLVCRTYKQMACWELGVFLGAPEGPPVKFDTLAQVRMHERPVDAFLIGTGRTPEELRWLERRMHDALTAPPQ